MKPHLRALPCLLLLPLLLAAAAARANDGGYGGSELEDSRELIDMGSYGSAIWQLKRFLEASPDNPDAHNLLAYSYRSLERFEEAERHYARALEIDPEHAGAHAYQGVLFLETGRPDAARRNLERLREICGRGCREYQDLRDAIQQSAAGN